MNRILSHAISAAILAFLVGTATGDEASKLLAEWSAASEQLTTADLTMLVLRDYGVGGSLTLEQLEVLAEASFDGGKQVDFESLFETIVAHTGNSPTMGEIRLRFDGESLIREDRIGNRSAVVNDGRLQELGQQGSVVVEQLYSDSNRSILGQELFKYNALNLKFTSIEHIKSDGKFASLQCRLANGTTVRFYYANATNRLRRIEQKLDGNDFQRTWCSEGTIDADTETPKCRLNAVVSNGRVETLTGYVVRKGAVNIPLSDAVFTLYADRRVEIAEKEQSGGDRTSVTYWMVAMNLIGIVFLMIWFIWRKR